MIAEYNELADYDNPPVYDHLADFINSPGGFSTTEAARFLQVPRRWVVEHLLVHRWAFRRKPGASLKGHDGAIRGGLVTRPCRITNAGLLLMGAYFNRAPHMFLIFEGQ